MTIWYIVLLVIKYVEFKTRDLRAARGMVCLRNLLKIFNTKNTHFWKWSLLSHYLFLKAHNERFSSILDTFIKNIYFYYNHRRVVPSIFTSTALFIYFNFQPNTHTRKLFIFFSNFQPITHTRKRHLQARILIFLIFIVEHGV